MGFHVADTSVFGLLFSFVGHVNQQVEPITIGIALQDRKELVFVKKQKFLHCRTKLVQQTAVLFATGVTCRFRFRSL